MNQVKKLLVTLALLSIPLLVLSGCEDERPILAAEQTNNAGRQVELLFKHKGCTMYRFRDAGHWVYYSDCRGNLESTYSEQEGDHEVDVHVQTLNN